MVSQFTASEHLNDPCHLFRRMSTHRVEQYSEPLLEDAQLVSSLSLCASSRLIQIVDVLVKALSRRSCCAFCAHEHCCLSPCDGLSFLLHVRHALTIRIDSSVPSSLKSDDSTFLSPSTPVVSLNKSLTSNATEFWHTLSLNQVANKLRKNQGPHHRLTVSLWWVFILIDHARLLSSPHCMGDHASACFLLTESTAVRTPGAGLV